MKLADFHILFINLDSRKDRRKWIENELERQGLLHRPNRVTKRIAGVKGQELTNNTYATKIAKEFGVPLNKMKADYWFSRRNFKTMSKNKKSILGRVGCYLGHLRAIKYVKKHKLYPALILEDDCVFLVKNNRNVVFAKPPKNADIFYIGGLFWHQVKPVPPIPKSTKWLKIDTQKLKLPCAFSYGFMQEEQIDNVINLLTSVWLDGVGKNKPKDWKSKKERIRATYLDLMFVNFIQEYGNAYVLHPVRAIQSDQFVSDVTDFGEMTPKNPYKHKYFYSDGDEEAAVKKYLS